MSIEYRWDNKRNINNLYGYNTESRKDRYPHLSRTKNKVPLCQICKKRVVFMDTLERHLRSEHKMTQNEILEYFHK